MWDSLLEGAFDRFANALFLRHTRFGTLGDEPLFTSMERLVERHAAVELTPLIPALNTIAADSHHHRDLTRSAALNVISSIRAVTHEVGELPISVHNPLVSTSSLPLAAEEPRGAEKA